MINVLLFVLLAALQAADVYSTYKIIVSGGLEQNPVMVFLMRHLGLVPALLLSKVAILLLAWFFLLPHPWVLAVVCAWYVYWMWHNWKSL